MLLGIVIVIVVALVLLVFNPLLAVALGVSLVIGFLAGAFLTNKDEEVE
jgi:hypothetical protein